MKRSDHINELASALSKVQAEMKPAPKNAINPFFKSSYANMASVHETTRPLLSKNGLCIMQTMDEGVEPNKVWLTTTLAHSSGQWISSEIPLNPVKPDPQSLGSYITYMRRYAEMAIIGLASDEDDDGEKAMNHEARGTTQTHPTEAQLKRLFAIKSEAHWTDQALKKFIEMRYQKQSTKELTWVEYEQTCKHIQQNPELG